VALDHSFVPILFFFPWIPNPHRTKCVVARTLFEKIFKEVIDERLAKVREDPNYQPPQDFLQVLMEAKYKDGTQLTMSEITGILIGALLGGQHTSNVTGTWILVHLLKSPEWLDRVMDEQKKIFAKKKQNLVYPSTLTYEEVQSMSVFEQVMSETLRLHHPFFQLSRAVKVDSKFKDCVIPQGHFVNISPLVSMRMPDIWGDHASEFDPNRFSEENKKMIEPYTWIPFGGGLHQCSGRKFAWNSLKASLSWLLRNYELEFVGKGAMEFPKEDYTTMVVAPTKAHCRVKYRRRKDAVS
jgi:sterol 14-demethylase